MFRDPFIKDVSANYFGENNVQIPIQSECDLAMLGVFSPKGWIAIDKTIVEKGVGVDMPTDPRSFPFDPFRQKSNGLEHVALFKGTWELDEPILGACTFFLCHW